VRWFYLKKKIISLNQGSPNSVLEGRCPAEFSPKPQLNTWTNSRSH